MTTYPSPIYLGQLGPVKGGDIADEAIDIEKDLVSGETVQSATVTLTDPDGDAVAGAITSHNESGTRTDFRIAVPTTAGIYWGTCVLTINDGQKLTRYFDLVVV
jgi:hypothetical protein